jgi:hypothetical protein
MGSAPQVRLVDERRREEERGRERKSEAGSEGSFQLGPK